jgi:hypothetical protein
VLWSHRWQNWNPLSEGKSVASVRTGQ